MSSPLSGFTPTKRIIVIAIVVGIIAGSVLSFFTRDLNGGSLFLWVPSPGTHTQMKARALLQ